MKKNINNQLFKVVFCLLAMGMAFELAVAQPGRSATMRTITALTDVSLQGELNTRYCAATTNLLTRQDRYTMASFEANALGIPGALWWEWPADQFGRWLSVLQVADGTGWTAAGASRSAVLNTILPLQHARGHFGTDPAKDSDNRVPSGNAFGLRGLMDAYDDTGNESALRAARKMVRFFEQTFDIYVTEGGIDEYYSHCLDGLVRLYRVDRTAEVLELSKRIAAKMGIHKHTHHALSAYRGVIELYDLTGDEVYLEQTERYLDYIKQSGIASGGIPELLPFTGTEEAAQDEGCALADYIVVNLMMFVRTGEDRFLETADNTLVNHFFMNQFHTGGFGHRRYRHDVVGDKVFQGWEGRFGSENPGCCSMWGQWALGQVGQYIVTRLDGRLEVNLYADAQIDIPEDDMHLVMKGDFPRQRTTQITIYTKHPKNKQISLRVPAWANDAVVRVNGKAVKHGLMGGRVLLDRKWRAGDEIEILFAGGVRLVSLANVKQDAVAIFDGPQCLGLFGDSTMLVGRIAVAVDGGGAPVLDGNGFPVVLSDNKPAEWALRPIADEWLHPNVKTPNHIKILFPTVHFK